MLTIVHACILKFLQYKVSVNLSSFPYVVLSICQSVNLCNMCDLFNLFDLFNLSNLSNLCNLCNLHNLSNLCNLNNLCNLFNLFNLSNLYNLCNPSNLFNFTIRRPVCTNLYSPYCMLDYTKFTGLIPSSFPFSFHFLVFFPVP